MKVAFTGHRPQRLKGKEKEIGAWIDFMLQKLMKEEKITAVYSGMAAGVDQLGAMKALALGLPVVCSFPYKRKNYHPQEDYIMERAAQIEYLCPQYSKESYTIRDRHMVDCADVLLAIWDGIPTGGTYKTVEYAKQQGKRIILIPQFIFDDGNGIS